MDTGGRVRPSTDELKTFGKDFNARWANEFQQYNLDIRYRKGEEAIVPDALSRRPDFIGKGPANLAQPTDEVEQLDSLRLCYGSEQLAAMRFKADETKSFPELMLDFKMKGTIPACDKHLENLIKER